jgi:predicted nucleic acid-binding protein
MKVVDSSYLIEGLLRDASLLERETFVAPDLALYEVVNTVWKHETRIRDLADSSERLSLFFHLISTETIRLIRPDEKLIEQTYSLSLRHRISTYDMVFVALALQLGAELRTFDSKQSEIMTRERGRAYSEAD